MLIDNLNLNHFRIFECVFRSRSMTAAARELHMTQSGVSQHIKALEDMLDVKLFDRIKQRLVPTAEGAALYKQAAKSLTEIEQALVHIKGGGKELFGTVSVGMPIEFGNNVILPIISKFAEKHPHVKFKFRLGLASEMSECLLSGELDFAFVDDLALDRRIGTEKVFDEVLDLCVSNDFIARKGIKGPPRNAKPYYEGLEYVEYMEGEPMLRMWFKHHLESPNLDLNVKATVMDVQGVARLILSGMGAGVIPSHLITKLDKEGKKLHRFKGKGDTLKNAISLAALKERTQSLPAAALIGFLKAHMGGTPAATSTKSLTNRKSSSAPREPELRPEL